MVNYMEPSQGEIIQKPKMQELSSLFMTHHINVMHALVKFHEYIPYSTYKLLVLYFAKRQNTGNELHGSQLLISLTSRVRGLLRTRVTA